MKDRLHLEKTPFFGPTFTRNPYMAFKTDHYCFCTNKHGKFTWIVSLLSHVKMTISRDIGYQNIIQKHEPDRKTNRIWASNCGFLAHSLILVTPLIHICLLIYHLSLWFTTTCYILVIHTHQGNCAKFHVNIYFIFCSGLITIIDKSSVLVDRSKISMNSLGLKGIPTDFPKQPCAVLEICEYQSHP